jgi:hypothetical protein
MKKLYNIFLILAAGLFITSCADEDTIRIPEFERGVSARASVVAEKSFLNFLDLANASYSFIYTSANADEIDRVDIFLTYTNLEEGETYPEVPFATVRGNEFPRTFDIPASELAGAFGRDISELGGGDTFDFRFVATMTDGRTFSAENSAPDINANPGGASFTTTLNTFVGCPTEIVSGSYTGTDAGCPVDPFGGAIRTKTDININQVGAVEFTISDVSLGYYTVFGFNDNQPVTLLDVCNNIGTSSNQAQFNIVVSGAHDPATSTIDLQWRDLGNGITCDIQLVKN